MCRPAASAMSTLVVALVVLSAALGAAAEDGQSGEQVPVMQVWTRILTRRSSPYHTPPSDFPDP
jgi:hypothetical protein